MSDAATLAEIPAKDVFHFDLYNDERLKVPDIQAGYATLLGDAPDIFWTPANGGHWVVTRHDLITEVMKDHVHFSARERDIPRTGIVQRMIPLFLDPPEHGGYRGELMRYFSPKVVRDLEVRMRDWAVRLIDAVADKEVCDFSEEIAARFPVSIFMELMGLPLDRFTEFRVIVRDYFGSYQDAAKRTVMRDFLIAEMDKLLDQRRREPREDLMSHLVTMEIRGRKLDLDEIRSIALMMFIAGLDTVAGTLGFTYRYLAGDTALQDRLRENPQDIPKFVEESLRRFAVVNPPRLVDHDYDFAGVHLRKGDMIAILLPCAGMDDRNVERPAEFDIDRPNREMIGFGTGVHVCLGNFLARAEMRIITEEWLKRVPRFRMVPGTDPRSRLSSIIALDRLDLEWGSRLES